MKKSFIYFIKTLIFPVIIFGVNFSIDFDSSKEFYQKFVSDLNYHDSLTIKSNIIERQLVKNRILYSKITDFKNTIVLGSSRSQLIGIPIGMNVSNFSVSGAVIGDFHNIYDLLEENKVKIDTIYMEISPWIFNDNNGEIRYQDWSESHLKTNFNKFLSINYFFYNINPLKYYPVNNRKGFIWYSDGTIKYASEFENIDELEAMKIYLNKKHIYHLKGFNSLKNLNKNSLEKLLFKMTSKCSYVILVKHPYPPLISDKILNRYPNIKKTDSILNEISSDFELTVLGSFYSDELNINNHDYYDGMHLTPKGLKKLLKHNGTPRKILDSSKLLSIGWNPKAGLITGIKKVYSHLEANQFLFN